MKRINETEQTRALMNHPFEDLRGQVTRDALCDAQLQADKDTVEASREKIAIFLEEHDGLEFTFEWKADQIIKLILEEK